ncbi:hypothetical protein CPB84DRAFT_177850 [Gymnopilus junonius]|uniref:Uncharacterized protein n=1 Tax=Gymnopilus junonius TaxID=109634 RepID=A0A9P5NHM3_GYMJU|nr:hypothetical protein CPB84DRAFT_177850 [Gymnopilus junonius]
MIQFPQLLDLLGLPAASTVSKGIKETLRELTRRHLDEKFSPFSQPQALKNVEKELLQRHPDLFAKEDQENKLYFALRVVSRFHNSRRYAISERQKRVKQAESVAEKHNKENIVINISDSVTTSKRVRVSVDFFNNGSALTLSLREKTIRLF